MASESREAKHSGVFGRFILRQTLKHQEVGAPRRGIPHALTWRDREMEPAWLADTLAEIMEQRREHRFDLVANKIVVILEARPINPAIRHGCSRHATDDGDFRFQIAAWRLNQAGRGMHYRHAVFYRDRLPARALHVDVAPGKTGKYQRLLAMDDMAAIKLRVDPDGQPHFARRGLDQRPVWYCCNEIAAEPYEHLGPTIDDCLHRVDNGVAMCTRRIEAEYLLDLVQQFRARLLVDADRAVALDVGMTTDRAYSGSRLAEIAAQQQKIGDLLHIRR